MSKAKAMVFLGAHPDDEAFGPAGFLSQYARAGVKVYVVTSTGGEEGTVAPEFLKGQKSIKSLREKELECAVQKIGVTKLFKLGYRDSGMMGNESNKHPECMAAAPMDEIVAKIVKIFREIKPDVVLTHDETGGYGHPDHIATHYATVKAFHAAGDPKQFPKAGPAFQPNKLYFPIRPVGSMKLMIKIMPLFGQNPRRFGRNKDIDLTKRLQAELPTHAIVKLSKESVQARIEAGSCHVSQGGGRFRGSGSMVFRIMRLLDGLKGPQDHFMRGFPAPNVHHLESDLFEGIK